ncbi:MAG TPA: MerR family transcriptional regulator [Terriglobales bacterium]|nr:MerR family transcriptional regulator [Terriglobales bacterium]
MKKDGGMLFGIGQIANLTGVNIQTIRRYDAKRILQGERDASSRYRQFDLLELTLLIRTRMYRNYGFSLDEIVDLLNTSPEDNIRMFEARQQSVEAELCRQQMLLECIQRQIGYLNNADMLVNNCIPGSRPEMYGIYYYDGHALLGDDGRRRVISQWIECTPFVLPMIRIAKDYFTGQRADYRIGLCVRKEYADELGLGQDPYSFHIPATPCLYTMADGKGVYTQNSERGPDPSYLLKSSAMTHAIEHIRRNELELSGDIFGSTFYSCRERDELRHFSHLWIPV